MTNNTFQRFSWLLGVFLTLFLWSAPAFAGFVLLDDFNSYNLGNLKTQGNWNCNSGNGAQVVSSPVYEGARAVSLSNFSNNLTTRTETTTATPKQIFYMLFPTTNPTTATACPASGTQLGGLWLSNDAGKYVSLHAFQCNDAGVQKVKITGTYDLGVESVVVGDLFPLSDTTWRELGIEVDVAGNQVKFDNGGVWTNWIADGHLTQAIDRVYLDRVSTGANIVAYLDTIRDSTFIPEPVCDINNCTLCLDQTTCETALCLWWFNPMIQDYSCAPALPETPPDTPDSWLLYYDENSDPRFTEPTSAVNAVAGSLDTIFQAVGAWLYGFTDVFQVDQASANGTSLGASIPLARGYLGQIDAFFSGLPVSGLFIFSILTLLVVSIYNIVKGLLHLIRG